MIKQKTNEVTRYIKKEVERELWARAAGRCEFDGCNRILYKSPVTQEQVNIGEKAHIYSFSENGPRRRGKLFKMNGKLNDINNLMLLCHDCHKLIDQDKKGDKYSASLLQEWKMKHELRVQLVTGINPSKQTNVIFYRANIGEQKALFDKNNAMLALFPNRYPASERSIDLSMKCSHEDATTDFWKSEVSHLKYEFNRHVTSLIEQDSTIHMSVFALAPMPLLIQLGVLLSDISNVDVYQYLREPKGWMWQDFPCGFKFEIIEPKNICGSPVLIISISDKINHERVQNALGEKTSIWEVTVPDNYLGNDNIRNKQQLSLFREYIREVMLKIGKAHGKEIPISIFPSMPVSCSVEMGRVRIPKADNPWVIYDHNDKNHGFKKTITIGGEQ